MKNPLTRSLIPTASILAFASVVAAQNPQSAGSSVSGFLNNARYELGRGLTFSSVDGGNSMTVGGQVQAGYSWADDGDNSANSSFGTDARLRVGGSVMDGKASYFVQMNPSDGGANNQNLVDAWVGWGLTDSINLRLGQQKMRSGLSAD
ncbi:MAG: porin, partial [Planctomycetota bacterium]|nr:porin [Planctomycetota bacterium]